MSSPSTQTVVVEGETYSATYDLVEPGLLHGTRRVPREHDSIETYAFGPPASIHFFDFDHFPLSVRESDRLCALTHKGALFLPSFTIQQILLPAGETRFESLATDALTPGLVPRRPTLFEWDGGRIPASLAELREFLEEAPQRGTFAMDRYAPERVRRAKREIDSSFQSDRTIASVARAAGAAHSSLSRAFQKTYALSPVAYRNKLRVMYSFWLLLVKHYSVVKTGYEAGFHNKSEFYRQFKREQKHVPSEFRFH